LFCSVITLITLAYLIVVPMRFAETKLNHAGIITGVEGLTMVFWFAGFVALAVFLGDRVCFGHVCSAAKAAAAFGAFEWYVTQPLLYIQQQVFVSLTAVIYCRLAFAVTFVLAVMPFVRNRGGISTRSDPKMNMSEGV
jgi:hypothetical protein